jgi:fucose permease
MNAQAVSVERRYGRPLLSSFHACYSLGVLGGGTLGTVAAASDVSPSVQLAATSVLLAVPLLVAGGWLPDEVPPKANQSRLMDRLRHRFTPQLALLACIAFLAALVEGAAGQWSAVYVTDSVGTGPAPAAAIYTAFTVATLVARLMGDRLIGHLGPRVFLRLSLLTAALGVATAVARPTPVMATAGLVILGLGIACVLPTVFGLAGRQPGLSTGEGVSVAVVGQWPGFFLATPLIGLLADASTLRIALVTLIIFAFSAALFADRIRVPAREAARSRNPSAVM